MEQVNYKQTSRFAVNIMHAATSRVTFVLLCVLFLLANTLPTSVSLRDGYDGFVAYGFPVAYKVTGRPWPSVTGDALSWMPHRNFAVDSVSTTGACFNLLCGALVLHGWWIMRRSFARPATPWRFSLRTLFFTMTAIACLVLVALSCMRQSERVRTTMTSVEQLGGHVQLRWSGPRALERLGLDIYLQRWKVVDGIVLRSRRLKDPDVSRLKSILDDNPQLARLDLRHTGLADAQVVSLPAVPSLLFLDLSGNPIDGTVLGRAEILRSVETLFVEQSESDNFEVPATSQCVSLRELYLYGTVIGDRSLARMQQFNQLKWVCIRGSKVSSSGIERLEEAKPDLCVAR